MKWLTVLLQLLQATLRIFERRQRNKEQAEYEDEKRKTQEDPAGWFDQHFNGDSEWVPDPATTDATKLPDADAASQADVTESKDQR